MQSGEKILLPIITKDFLLGRPIPPQAQAKLDEFYTFPCGYVFKFIAPMARVDELAQLLRGKPFTTRYSRNAKYVSFTAEWEVRSSEEVISFYREAAKIKGVIAL